MPALEPTGLTGRVRWLGRVPDRDAALASESLPRLRLAFAGPEGENHGGLTRPSCSRVLGLYERGTPIRNARQLSILSQEELEAVAAAMGLDALDPAWLGATMVVEGLPDFSHLPPASRLQFRGRGGPTVAVDMQNRPCVLPGPVIEAARPGFGTRFKRAAEGRRGVVGSVEREGVVDVGDAVALHVPDQRAWQGAGGGAAVAPGQP
ncbi:MOSC domain-containing protein [Jannaschia sp. W003]|uniref:MOSC domain-containing protein n=1 Tax=Jannaschia sp. W003 TaxID=2867012 RepID=UPI0021A264E4|nr:MOSC domain-containing protein [Jannaschia sp. W003]UWQ22522.1 MOSC domain-containing protein [Jannaschia sp. W003]